MRPLTSNEVQKYIEDVAKSMTVDLSDADYDDTQRMLNKVSSLSQEIVKHRNAIMPHHQPTTLTNSTMVLITPFLIVQLKSLACR